MDLHFSKEFLSQTSCEESLAHFWAHRRSLHIDGAEEMVSLRVFRLPIDCLMANYLDIVYDILIEGSTIFWRQMKSHCTMLTAAIISIYVAPSLLIITSIT